MTYESEGIKRRIVKMSSCLPGTFESDRDADYASGYFPHSRAHCGIWGPLHEALQIDFEPRIQPTPPNLPCITSAGAMAYMIGNHQLYARMIPPNNGIGALPSRNEHPASEDPTQPPHKTSIRSFDILST